MSERRDFEFHIGDKDVVMKLGNCAVFLFVNAREVSYLAVDLEDDSMLQVFNNPGDVEWMAGYRIVDQGDSLHRPVVRKKIDGVNVTFRELVGWNPTRIEREDPQPQELEKFMNVNLEHIDDEWRELG